jgi:hypothetical protein
VLAGQSERPLLATKVGAEHADGRLIAAQRPEQLRAQVHANLTSLSVEQLDLVYLRRLDTPPGIIAEGEQIVDFDSQLAELTALRDAGLIAAIGLSSVSVEQTRAALPAGIVAVQNAYGVLDRSAANTDWRGFPTSRSAPPFQHDQRHTRIPPSRQSPKSSRFPPPRSRSRGCSPDTPTRCSSPAPPTPATFKTTSRSAS